MKPYFQEADEVLRNMQSSPEGLSTGMAEKLLAEKGPNKLEEGKKKSLLQRFLKQLAEPMLIILMVAAVLSLVTGFVSGEPEYADAIIILAVVIINAVLGVVQESKAEKAIEALQAISAAKSKVIRDGSIRQVPTEEVVPGDIVVLEAGDSVPADGRLIETASMKVEEAALTGESVPSEKDVAKLSPGEGDDVPLGDRANMVYMGSTVVYGRGKAVITGTGMDTEMGKIAYALQEAKDEATPLQVKLNQLSRVLTFLVLGICVVIFAVDLVRMSIVSSITIGGILDTSMIAISLAVAAIPEGLAAVVTIVLSIGVTKMSRNKAIIRKLTAVETLGCTEVICSDKTGTLTQNKMTVVEAHSPDNALLARAMSLCSDAVLDDNRQAVGEPTECALVNYAWSEYGFDKGHAGESEFERVGEAPFDSMRKLMSTVHPDKDGFVQYTKGAPDEILKKCTCILTGEGVRTITDFDRDEIMRINKSYADKALRVLAAAMRKYDALPSSFKAEDLERDLVFIGLVGMIDPVRPEVKAAISECRQAGIRPIMITGDHKDTAIAIAKELGIIESADEAITGSELDKISDEDFSTDIVRYSVYARVQPEHKVRIVNEWKKLGKVTAMTGDGVNDAPSIKNADIGIGMGITGTDVTKNVADMVLADDNFATIVGAVAEGRRIYDNIRKSIQYLLASNLAEVISIFISSIIGFTILKPAHLLWINLITDSFPAVALGMEDGEEDLMRRPPRSRNEGLFAGGLGVNCLFQGAVVAAITIASFFVGEFFEHGRIAVETSNDGMTMAFLTLSMLEMFHAINMRSLDRSIFTLRTGNRNLFLCIFGSFLLTIAVLYVPFLRNAFGFGHISLVEFVIAIALAVLIIPIVEIEKLVIRKMSGKRFRKNRQTN